MGREKNWPAVELDGKEGGREGERGSSCRRRVGVVWKKVDLRVSLRAAPCCGPISDGGSRGQTSRSFPLFSLSLPLSSSLLLAARHILCSLPYPLDYLPAWPPASAVSTPNSPINLRQHLETALSLVRGLSLLIGQPEPDSTPGPIQVHALSYRGWLLSIATSPDTCSQPAGYLIGPCWMSLPVHRGSWTFKTVTSRRRSCVPVDAGAVYHQVHSRICTPYKRP